MKYKFSELIDIEEYQNLSDKFTKFTKVSTAMIDFEGNVLTKSGWVDICVKFHRANPGTFKRCLKSDTILANEIEKGKKYQTKEGKKYHIYECENGLTDVVFPIFIRGEHVGNVFIGQFLLEKPDINYFKKQAKEFGFDEKKYLEALANVPIFTEEEIEEKMDFLLTLAEMLGNSGYGKLNLLETNEELLAVIKTKEKMYQKAITDGLTGLYNHVFFQKSLLKEIKHTKRDGLELSLIFLDIDNFKSVNDKYGHQAGDKILKEVAKISKRMIRKNDIIARYGGEEIVILLPNTNFENGYQFAEKLRMEIEKTMFVTVSLGISNFPQNFNDLFLKREEIKEELIKKADAAMYYSKDNGKNQVTKYRDSIKS